MNRIRLLPEHVANQIAAGEVVERPASVVKELVENSLDAGATRIEIEVRHGGRSLIRVSDNGCGMSRDDALLALERHATSKICSAEDLEHIATLGFRGEAIPSIAAVSRFQLITRETDAATGTEINLAGGKLLDVKEVGAPAGTTVVVRNLFFNMPARRKFLRSLVTESAHIGQMVTLHALAHPAVAFWLKQDERVVCEVASCRDLLARIRELYGPQLCQELLPLTLDTSAARLRGFVGRPGVSRADRSQLHCFVNGRPVDSKTIHHGLLEGYHTALMRGRYPVAFVFVEVDPAAVDVNIHPAKREVRFRNEREVRAAVVEAVRAAIEPARSAEGPREAERGGRSSSSTVAVPPSGSLSPPAVTATVVPLAPRPAPLLVPPSVPGPVVEPKKEGAGGGPFGFRLLGVIGDLYILAESREGLVLIDQHAAHERVLFEQMLRRNETQAPPSQKLLLPETIETDHRDAAFLRENLDTLQQMGIGIREFGDRTFLIDALPPFLARGNIRQLFRDIVDELREAGRDVPRGRLSETAVATSVCRHAVKARDPLRAEEISQLLADLHACDLPYTCPHGRPTMIQISYPELEKKFGRRT